MVHASALIVTTVLLVMAAHQTALAAGAPMAEPALATQCRGRTKLAGPYRVISTIATAVLVLAAFIVAARGDLIPKGELSDRSLTWGTAIVGAYLGVNAATDLASTDTVKRWLASTAKIVAAVLCVVIVLAAQPQ